MGFLEQILADVGLLPPWAALCAIVIASFVSEDLTCIGAGLLCAKGELSPTMAMFSSGLGIFLGDLALYLAGKHIGQPALRRRPLRWFLSAETVVQSEEWFAHRGPIVILLGRFVPGSRLPSYFAAGLLNIGLARFALFALIAVAIWSPLLVGVSMLFGRGVLRYYELFQGYAWVVLLAALCFLWVIVKLVLPMFSWRGRRLLYASWRRLVRWEYWPPWMFYAPVFLYVLILALRHKSLSLITAVNPAFPAGGFVGESKWDILCRLEHARGCVVRMAKLTATGDGDHGLRAVRKFLDANGLDYPVALKPDAGQRGSGVVIARSDVDVHAYFRRTRVETLIQEFAGGPEFGVFYYRLPGEPEGRILSITEKRFPAVVGDGRRTLEELILFDERAVCMATVYLRRNASRLWEVPAEGERIELVDVGNHCRGAVFCDGRHLKTREMELAFDSISQGVPGFFFGRYDVRAGSVEEFCAGQNFKIIELNGGTSEATHIYDAKLGLLEAYAVLFEQWRILFAIAKKNREGGAACVPWTELVKQMGRYRIQARSHPT